VSKDEKRLEKRFPLTAPVQVKIRSCPGYPDLEGARFPGRTSDVSMNGIRLHLDRILPVDTFMEMDVTLAKHVFLMCGQVIWSKPVAESTVHAGVKLIGEDQLQLSSWKTTLSRVLLGEE
jgi:hypothetical protein